MSAEPTAEQREAAEVLFDQLLTMHGGTDQTYAIARALAAAVTAEREKYLRVADELDVAAESQNAEASRDFDRGDQMGGANLTGQFYATAHAARRIREVSS